MINILYILPIIVFLLYGKIKYKLIYLKFLPIIFILMGIIGIFVVAFFIPGESIIVILIKLTGSTFIAYSAVKGIFDMNLHDEDKNDE